MDPVKSAEPSGKSNEFIKLTDNVAKTAALPEMGDYILRDTENRQVGLALRIYSSGVRSWVVQKIARETNACCAWTFSPDEPSQGGRGCPSGGWQDQERH